MSRGNPLGNPLLKYTQFKSPSVSPEVVLSRKSIGVKLSVEADAIVRAFPDMSEFIRNATMEKLEREGYLQR